LALCFFISKKETEPQEIDEVKRWRCNIDLGCVFLAVGMWQLLREEFNPPNLDTS